MKKYSILKKATALLIAAALTAGLAACGSSSSGAGDGSSASTADFNNYSADDPVTVKVGLTAAIYEDIWDPIKEELAGEGIDIEYVQFSDYAMPNEALVSGEIDMTAQQHHAYMENQIKEENWGDAIEPIADTFIIAMNLYSDKIKDVSELKDGDTIALPNDLSNEGRALKLLQSAGIIELDPNAGKNPEKKDITKYNVQIELKEVNSSDTVSLLPDVTAAVINGNFALDAGIDPDKEAIFEETEYSDDSYFCVLGARKEDADSKAFKRITEAFQSDGTKEIFQDEFKGYFKPAWEYKFS